MATETDAARDRVLAARAALGDELETLEASVRAAVDVPAKIRRSPAKAAAIIGSAAFLALGGPKRVLRAGKRAVTGEKAALPKSMLPKEVEKTLRKLGDDGDKVRGALERDFATYARKAKEDRAAPTAPAADRGRTPAPDDGCEGRGEMVPPAGPGGLPGTARPGPRAHPARGCRGPRGDGSGDEPGRRGGPPRRFGGGGRLTHGRLAPGPPPAAAGARSRSGARPVHWRRASGGMADAPALGAGAA